MIQRKNELSQLITESPCIALSRYVEGTGIALYQTTESRELEGVVAKRKDNIYYMGKRSKEWIKFKRMTDEDFVVTGYLQKSLHSYSIVLGKYRQGVLIYKGHVTAGVTRDAIASLKPITENPFHMLPAGNGNEETIWGNPDHVCIVEYMPNTKNLLRQPVFKGFRDDVFPKEVQI